MSRVASFVTHPLVVRQLTVARVADLSDRMRRVTLVGEQLADFVAGDLALPGFVSGAFDDHVKLVFAEDGDLAAALPVQLAHTIDWPEAPHRQTRDYTVRRFDPVAGELDLDFVRHGTGPAATWAEAAEPGAAVHLAGPKSSLVLPEGVDWVLLAGDETALPAIGRYLDERPLDVPVQVVVEIRAPSARLALATRPGDVLRWVETPPGSPSTLADAVRVLEWWPGQVYAWAAGESTSLVPLRRWLSRDRALPRTHREVTGYWRAAPEQVPAPGEADPAPPGPDPETLLSPVPWLATRAAMELGLLDAVADRPRPVAELAAATSLDADAVRALTAYLVSVDVLASPDGGARLALGPVGEEVLGDDELRASVTDGLEGRLLTALLQLAPALRAAEPAYGRQHGRTLLADLEADAGRFAEQVEEVTSFAFVAAGLLAMPAVAGAERVAVTGAGAAVLADLLAQRCAVTVVESPGPLAALRAVVPSAAVAFGTEVPAADVVVSALGLAYRTDEEAVALLSGLAAAGGRAVVVEELAGPGLSDGHEAEHALLALAGTGRARRTAEDLARLAAAAGWEPVGTASLGWNHEAVELRR